MNYNTIDYGYKMNVVDDNILKYEIEYNEIEPEVRHYSVSFNEAITTSPTTYTDSEGTEYSWNNQSIVLSEIDTEM